MENETVIPQTCYICKDVGLSDKTDFISPEHTEVRFYCKDERACDARRLRRDALVIQPLLSQIRSRTLTNDQAMTIIALVCQRMPAAI